MTADGATDRCRWAPVVHADGHAGAMNVYMTMVRPGLLLQREGPGSEPRQLPVAPRSLFGSRSASVWGLRGLQCRASLLHNQHNQKKTATKMASYQEGQDPPMGRDKRVTGSCLPL